MTNQELIRKILNIIEDEPYPPPENMDGYYHLTPTDFYMWKDNVVAKIQKLKEENQDANYTR